MTLTTMAGFLLFLMVFYAVSGLLLRFSCGLANYAGRWSPQWPAIQIPRYRTCVEIVFGVASIYGLLCAAFDSLITSWVADFFAKRTWNAIASVVEILLVAKLVAWGLSNEQPSPTRLVTLASAFHLLLIVASCYAVAWVFWLLN